MTLNIEIWSDVVCPWCYVGKRRFEKALAQFPHRDAVKITWRSFELNPDAPAQSEESLEEHLAHKMRVSTAQAAQLNTRITALAAEEGLEYRLDLAHPANTFAAHRLLHLAAAHGLGDAATERLMRAYFTEGANLGDAETLARLAAEVGLDADEARATLASDTWADETRADEERAARLGIHGVPFFVLDGRYGVSGAQPTEVFLQALQTAWEAAQPLTLVGAPDADESDANVGLCEDDSCAI